MVTRAEYLEIGSNACRRKFADWKPMNDKDGDGRVGKDANGPGSKGKGVSRVREDFAGDEDDGDDGEFVVGKKGKGRGRPGAGVASRRK